MSAKKEETNDVISKQREEDSTMEDKGHEDVDKDDDKVVVKDDQRIKDVEEPEEEKAIEEKEEKKMEDDVPKEDVPKEDAKDNGEKKQNGGPEEGEKDKKNGKKKEDGGGGRKESGGFEIISIKEKHGQLRQAVPVMPLPLAVVLCMVNVLLPGIGTLVSAFVVFCGGKTEYESKGKAFGLNVISAILQLVTLPIIVGWIWSIVWGVTFVTSAMSKDDHVTKDGGQAAPPEHV